MKARITAIERKLRTRITNATGASSMRCFVGDGERWRETTFDYASNMEIVSMLWDSFQTLEHTNATLERLEARGVEVIRTIVPASGMTAGMTE